MNEIIYKEEEESTAIYLIKNGEVEISQELEIQIRPPNESESLIKNFTKKRKKNCKYKRHKVALINDGQIFG